MLTVALGKGRLAEETKKLFERAGIDCSVLSQKSRKLVLFSGEYKFILVKPFDVPAYVERGAADLGVCGKDVLLETAADVYEMCDLGIGKCKMCVAGTKMPDVRPVVATKYKRIAAEYFNSRGVDCDLIYLGGSVELAPIAGLSDVIVDIVQTGDTLKENGLEILDDILNISARLIANKVSLKLKSGEMLPFISSVRNAVSI